MGIDETTAVWKSGRERAGKKWQVFLNAVWETIREQITEGWQKWEAILARTLGVN